MLGLSQALVKIDYSSIYLIRKTRPTPIHNSSDSMHMTPDRELLTVVN